MFVDASAIVAILLKETGATDLTNQIDDARDPVTSTSRSSKPPRRSAARPACPSRMPNGRSGGS